MKIRNVAFIAALIVWIALAVYYVTPSESAVAKEIETAPKTVGETLSAIAQSLKHEGEEKRKQLRMLENMHILMRLIRKDASLLVLVVMERCSGKSSLELCYI